MARVVGPRSREFSEAGVGYVEERVTASGASNSTACRGGSAKN